ncbi:MAG TPA: hypothetical protein VMR19_00380 [Candidatus Saccharimonadales bacterium]|jgi:hypothetical protein|nr:hypothetical protein [Candidatus Saccharimonadales bacterium]
MTQPASKSYRHFEEEKVQSEFLRNKLKLKNLEAKRSLFEKYPHVEKFLKEKGLDLSKIREHSAKIITTSALAGTLFFAPPTLANNMPKVATVVKSLAQIGDDQSTISKQEILLSSLRQILPQKVGPLERTQEKTLEQVFNETVGINTKATLEGEHLNTTYGYIGAEQHLARYPGDNMSVHPKIPEFDEGMAPGLGAWGYVPSDDEKWYAVVQTLYLPDWDTRQPYLLDWYKYRKILIVNTINGNAVVADIADSGPATWTGKQFGGSPEVMNYLGGPRYKKGPVVVFFVDDPKNQIPLGPVDYNNIDTLGVTVTQV